MLHRAGRSPTHVPCEVRSFKATGAGRAQLRDDDVVGDGSGPRLATVTV